MTNTLRIVHLRRQSTSTYCCIPISSCCIDSSSLCLCVSQIYYQGRDRSRRAKPGPSGPCQAVPPAPNRDRFRDIERVMAGCRAGRRGAVSAARRRSGADPGRGWDPLAARKALSMILEVPGDSILDQCGHGRLHRLGPHDEQDATGRQWLGQHRIDLDAAGQHAADVRAERIEIPGFTESFAKVADLAQERGVTGPPAPLCAVADTDGPIDT